LHKNLLVRGSKDCNKAMSDTLKQLKKTWIDELKYLYLDLDGAYVEFTDKNGGDHCLEASKLEDGKVYGKLCEWECDDFTDVDETITISIELSLLTLWGLAELIDQKAR
jgi:hypothetical protein